MAKGKYGNRNKRFNEDPHTMTDKDCEKFNKIHEDPAKRFSDDELDLIINLKHEGMSMDKIIEKILEERNKNTE